MVTVEVQPGQLPVQAVYEGHPLRHVDGELHGAGRVHHQPRALVQHRVQAAHLVDKNIKLTSIIQKHEDFTITEKAPTRTFSWLKVPTSAFTFKTLLRHYAKWALTPY